MMLCLIVFRNARHTAVQSIFPAQHYTSHAHRCERNTTHATFNKATQHFPCDVTTSMQHNTKQSDLNVRGTLSLAIESLLFSLSIPNLMDKLLILLNWPSMAPFILYLHFECSTNAQDKEFVLLWISNHSHSDCKIFVNQNSRIWQEFQNFWKFYAKILQEFLPQSMVEKKCLMVIHLEFSLLANSWSCSEAKFIF